jgi:hypothetical protein
MSMLIQCRPEKIGSNWNCKHFYAGKNVYTLCVRSLLKKDGASGHTGAVVM